MSKYSVFQEIQNFRSSQHLTLVLELTLGHEFSRASRVDILWTHISSEICLQIKNTSYEEHNLYTSQTKKNPKPYFDVQKPKHKESQGKHD